MWQFLKFVLATLVGMFLFFILGIFLLGGIAASFSSPAATQVESNSVLRLDLNKPIDELSADDPFEGMNVPFVGASNLGLVQIKESILNAKSDNNIKGIFLEANYPMTGYATLEELRNALIDFKKSGKFVVAYGEIYSEKGYYLSSIASKIYLNPAGILELNGISSQYTFFKGTLDKLEIKPEIFKVGEFKSAVEPFIREDMSEPSRLQTQSFLGSINDYTFSNIAQARGLEIAQLKKIADSLLIREAEDALTYKLITNLGYYDEAEADMKKSLKLSATDKINFVTLEKYRKAEQPAKTGNADNRIAVIIASGDIVSGKGGKTSIGSDKIAAEIRKARLDKKIKAVVLRINSPGGSALASDVLWREVILTKKVKPIIASMSDVAASGGYYMAMGCDKIVAHPNTITGSIGIFGMLFNLESFLKNKLGVTVDGVKTNTYADFPTVTRNMSDFEKSVIQRNVEHGYDIFTSKAAQGRHISQDSLKVLASGRVWSGLEAKQNGLVDELGGLETAIALAAKAAKLKANDYRVRYYPEPKNVIEELFSQASEENEARQLRNQFGILAPHIQSLMKLKNMEGIQARLPYDLELK